MVDAIDSDGDKAQRKYVQTDMKVHESRPYWFLSE